MTADPSRLDEVFSGALSATALGARVEYLDRECRGDGQLRERVEALLAAHEAAANFFPTPNGEITAPFAPLAERPGSTIGRYKLLEQIGEGGFGVVFMAEQEQPVRRRVALKIIKLGMDTKQVVARFEAERQALALMDHPNIAKVFDAGATETGRPYFVMELVRGVPITDFCDEARFSDKERLKLMQTVCSAVQHAHQKGIIHRDLKPSNVLVTLHDDVPVPKVIDFGVAKATQARLTERTLFTEFRQMVGTPAYMSPEQAQMSGLDVDTRSDVYSLGVLLYELLTGSTPIEVKKLSSATYDDIRRLICEVDPPSPSARLSTLTDEELTTLAKQRHCGPTQLSISLRSDLDWIVMKCLEKDRKRRYESASALAQDLQRYLDGEAVEARPPSHMYRLRKFVRRNKLGVIAGTAIVSALVAGLALASYGLVHARRQAAIAKAENARSEQVAKFLTNMLSAVRPGVARGRDTALLLEILDKTAEQIEDELKDQPEVQGDLWSTLAGTYSALDNRQKAAELYQNAITSYESAQGSNEAKLAISLGELGDLQSWLGDKEQGRLTAARGVSVARAMGHPATLSRCLLSAWNAELDPNGHVSESAREVDCLEEALTHCPGSSEPVLFADIKAFLALSLIQTKSDRAVVLSKEALELYRLHLPEGDEKIARCHYYLGQIHAHRGEHDEAVNHLSKAVEIERMIYPPAHSGPLNPMDSLADSLATIGKQEEALRLREELLSLAKAKFGLMHRFTFRSMGTLANTYNNLGRYEEALKLHEKTLALRKTELGSDDFDTLTSMNELANTYSNLNRDEEARRLNEEALAGWISKVGLDHSSTLYTMQRLAYTQLKLGLHQDAVERFSEISKHSEATYGKSDRRNFDIQWDIVSQLRTFGLYEQALEPARAHADLCLSIYGLDSILTSNALLNHGYVLRGLKRNKDALPVFKQAFDAAQNTAPPRLQLIGVTAIEYGATFRMLGQYNDALSVYRKAINLIKKVSPQQTALPNLLRSAADAHANVGEFTEARQCLNDSLAACADQDWKNRDLTAWALATSKFAELRNGKQAVQIATEAVSLSKSSEAGPCDTLAAAHAEAGDFDSAMEWEQKAIDLAPDQERFRTRLESYRNKKRWWIDE